MEQAIKLIRIAFLGQYPLYHGLQSRSCHLRHIGLTPFLPEFKETHHNTIIILCTRQYLLYHDLKQATCNFSTDIILQINKVATLRHQNDIRCILTLMVFVNENIPSPIISSTRFKFVFIVHMSVSFQQDTHS
jgi:hypothetical protein